MNVTDKEYIAAIALLSFVLGVCGCVVGIYCCYFRRVRPDAPDPNNGLALQEEKEPENEEKATATTSVALMYRPGEKKVDPGPPKGPRAIGPSTRRTSSASSSPVRRASRRDSLIAMARASRGMPVATPIGTSPTGLGLGVDPDLNLLSRQSRSSARRGSLTKTQQEAFGKRRLSIADEGDNHFTI